MASITMPGYDTIQSINFTGGFPTDKDLAPSIIFSILYALSLPVLVWRFVDPTSRNKPLIRPAIFAFVRLGSMVLRAVMSKNNYGIGELIAELTLVSIGYLFLISPVVTLWKRHVDNSSPPPHPGWVNRLDKLLQLTLLASIGTAIAGGALTSNAFQSQSGMDTVKNLRHASNILSLVTIAVATFALIATHFKLQMDIQRTGYLLIPALSLLIVAVYRVAQTFENNPNSSARTLAAFWVLQILFEFIAYVSLLAIKIPEWFPNPEHNGSRNRSDSEAGVDASQSMGLVGRLRNRY